MTATTEEVSKRMWIQRAKELEERAEKAERACLDAWDARDSYQKRCGEIFDQLSAARGRISELEEHRRTWRRIAYRLSDKLESIAKCAGPRLVAEINSLLSETIGPEPTQVESTGQETKSR